MPLPSARVTPGRPRSIWAFLRFVLVLMMCRIGEARVPGPDSDTWTLGIVNPSGLQGKYHVLDSVNAEVLAISETHLSAQAKRGLAYSFRSHKSRFKHVLTGAPMAPRSLSSDAGQWAGVAFASAYPCRTIAAPWPSDLYETGRIQFAAFHTPSDWISGAVIYGYPEGKTHTNAHAKTEAILDFAWTRLQAQTGPRFMAGDWNFTPDRLQLVSHMQAAGWVEVQDHARSLTGQAVVPTCKQTTRKDFLWMSPELALGFTALRIDPQVFADHSVLLATFVGGKAHLERFVWPCPQPIAWTSVPDLPTPVCFACPLDPTAQYADLWRQKEALAEAALAHEWSPAMAGRGQQTKPRRVVGRLAPLRQGRMDDVQPGFFGFSALHVKRFKQLRRLQNYCRWADNHAANHTSDSLHGIGLWNSILHASGFGVSFSSWWPSRCYVSPLDPPAIPPFCPSPLVARQVYDALLADVRLLEQRLTMAKKAHRVAHHDRDHQLVFRDVARPVAAPVETLVHRVEAKVAFVDQSECAIELDRSVHVLPDEPVWVSGQVHEVIHAEGDKVWVHDVTTVQVNDVCVQTKPVGDLQALFDAFHEQWRLRWCRHDGVPFSRWQELLDFARQIIRPTAVPHLAVDSALLQAEVHRKKKRAATGLDGVSRSDLVMADPATLASLTKVYQRAETDGAWPAQLVAGKVHSLAKTESASTVGDYRPITIFGLPYRAWSSIQSRHLLAFADQWVDDSVFGNRRGRQASDLWLQLLTQIEQAYTSSTGLAGISADIEKCFNCIPRFPALCLAVLVGTPHEVTTAWSGALASMCRHFKVRESFSSGFLTSTGLAEGCGLSVFGMLLVDHLFACWLRFQAPPVHCLTYVDDWQTITRDVDYTVRQLELVEQFAALIDLTVDRKKTFGWATCPDMRRLMRDKGIRVLHHARELGGHMGISKQYTNCTVAQRIAALGDFWVQLRSSNARYKAKVYMLRAVAWPRGLHAISSAPIGDQTWLALRRSAVKALGWQRPGVNPAVLLSLVEPMVDPQFVAISWTFRSLRAQCPLDFWAVNVSPLAHGDLDLPPNAPASIALQRVQALGFQVDRAGCVIDQFGSFCLHTCNITEVDLRLQWAWKLVVAQKVSHRLDFNGLWQVDLAATRKALAALGPDDQALYRLGLAGGLYTESYKAKWTDQADCCHWCGQPDTLKHRFWECPQHGDLRASLAPDVLLVLDQLPPVMSLRGWALLPPTWHSWIQLLVNLPPCSLGTSVGFAKGVWNHVFTDGSCLFQSCPLYRCAAWSATLVPAFCSSWTPGGTRLVGASYLPGICQTAFRAELFAVAFTLHQAAEQGAPVKIWTDCLGVIAKYNLLVRGHKKLNPNRSNADLWAWVLQSADRLGRQYIELCKVPAHRPLSSATTRFEAWMFFNNDIADRAARMANQARPPCFWDIWEAHAQATGVAATLFQQVQALHLAVGRRQVQSQVSDEPGDPDSGPVRHTREFVTVFERGSWNGSLLPKVTRLYGTSVMQKINKWFMARLAPSADVVWVSFAQLYLDFQMSVGHPGPLRVQNHWIDADQRPYLAVETFSFKQRTKWFRQCLKHLWKEAALTVGLEQCRPRSVAIHAFLPSASLPWDTHALAVVDEWLGAHLRDPCAREASALNSLPPPTKCGRLQV